MVVKKFFLFLKRDVLGGVVGRRPRWKPSHIFYSILLSIDNLVGGGGDSILV